MATLLFDRGNEDKDPTAGGVRAGAQAAGPPVKAGLSGSGTHRDGPRSGNPPDVGAVNRYGLKAFDAATRVREASSLADEPLHNG